jgi:hypothetical protein
LQVDEDDLNAPVTIETYMEWRMKPMLAAFNLKAPRLGLALSVLENLVLLLTSLSMVLGIVQWYNWVTTAVSIRAIVSNIMEYEAVSLRLGITNKGEYIHEIGFMSCAAATSESSAIILLSSVSRFM